MKINSSLNKKMPSVFAKIEGGLRFERQYKESHKDNPLVTVITVVYNDGSNLEETIKSVLTQKYKNIEYIIIDGGSNDNTLDVIRKYESKIDYWVSERDFGIYDAMNKGISAANGQWLNMMNSGDVFATVDTFSFLEIGLPSVDIYYSDTILVGGGGGIAAANVFKKAFIHQSLIYRKSLHETYGMYLILPGVTISDYLFFSNFWNDVNSTKVNQPIARYSVDGISSNRKHFYQKMAVDLMCGFRSPVSVGLILVLYPLYKMLKNILVKYAGFR